MNAESNDELLDGFEESLHIKLTCRTVRIGSYKYIPPEDVMISQDGIRLIIPRIENRKFYKNLLFAKLKAIKRELFLKHQITNKFFFIIAKKFVKMDIKFDDIVRVLIHFGRHLPVLFFFTSTGCGQRIRKLLGMENPNGLYYDPASQGTDNFTII